MTDTFEFDVDLVRKIVAAGVSDGMQFAINNTLIHKLADQIQANYRRRSMKEHPNPLNRAGEKFFSQNEEDGILLEIIRRINPTNKTFIEFGVGNGLENNTLILLFSGWTGKWVGGQELAYQIPANNKLWFRKEWITKDNCIDLVGDKCPSIFSLDLDGNDLHIMAQLLNRHEEFRPDVIICEYNAKFPPPINFSIKYDPKFVWEGKDYQGASLQAFKQLIEFYHYQLVCCNITGSNAFFVKEDHWKKFKDIPTDIGSLYCPPNDGLTYCFNNLPDPKTILRFLEGG